jgi:hypothetical protein
MVTEAGWGNYRTGLKIRLHRRMRSWTIKLTPVLKWTAWAKIWSFTLKWIFTAEFLSMIEEWILETKALCLVLKGRVIIVIALVIKWVINACASSPVVGFVVRRWSLKVVGIWCGARLRGPDIDKRILFRSGMCLGIVGYCYSGWSSPW